MRLPFLADAAGSEAIFAPNLKYTLEQLNATTMLMSWLKHLGQSVLMLHRAQCFKGCPLGCRYAVGIRDVHAIVEAGRSQCMDTDAGRQRPNLHCLVTTAANKPASIRVKNNRAHNTGVPTEGLP